MSRRRETARRTLAPGDVVSRHDRARQIQVGGRIINVTERELQLADALAAVSVRLRRPEPGLRPGHLLVVTGRLLRGSLHQAQVVEHYPAPEPAAAGEFASTSFTGLGRQLRCRARAVAAIRHYFSRRGFMEVDTPVRVRCPGLDANVDAVRAEGGWLITSPELHMKRLLAGGLPRIFQLARCSRLEELGTWHEPEFLLLEWYRAFADHLQLMRDTEQLVAAVTRAVAGSLRIRLPAGRVVDATPPYERVTVLQAFRQHAGEANALELAARDETRFFKLLVEQVEPALGRRTRPVFLCDYPPSQAALARIAPGPPAVAQRFELYLGGVELCNGYAELTDPIEQRRRFERERARRRRQRRPVYPIDERFLAALAEGVPPSAGNALGVDRLIALASGVGAIAQVQAFCAARL